MRVAHAPAGHTISDYEEIVDPRVAAEMVSVCYLHCVLKGLHKAPRPVISWGTAHDLSVADVDCLVSPHGCFGSPHHSCLDNKIPIIVVEENTTLLDEKVPGAINVKNYLEAAGVIQAMKIGVTIESVTRPIKGTTIL